LPLGAKSAFEHYASVLGAYFVEARRFADEYLEKPWPDPNFVFDIAGYERLDGLEEDVLAKRNTFIDVSQKELAEGTTTRPPTGLRAILSKFKGH
jgi:hypothetical protein